MGSGLLTGRMTRERIEHQPDDDWRKSDERFREPQRSRNLELVGRLRTVVEAVCRQAGFVPRIVAETSDLGVMLSLVAEKVGIAMLPRSAPEGAAGVTAIDLTHPRIERRIVLVWRADDTPPAARAFLALATDELTER